MLWKTWDNRIIDYSRLSWQHLSNIHYFMNLLNPKHYHKELKDIVRNTLYKKHGGILPYHPDPHFEQERNLLDKLGYLDNQCNIVVHGLKIGWYEEIR